MMKKTLIVALLVLSLFSLSYAETKSVSLSKNPFIKPHDAEDLTGLKRAISDTGETLTDTNLRATLLSAQRSIANIDGVMVFVGDKIKGYTLISVGEGSATFIKNEKEITLSVNELHKKLRQ